MNTRVYNFGDCVGKVLKDSIRLPDTKGVALQFSDNLIITLEAYIYEKSGFTDFISDARLTPSESLILKLIDKKTFEELEELELQKAARAERLEYERLKEKFR